MSMLKIGMIGDYESSIGFKAVGVDTYVVRDFKEAKDILLSLVKSGYGIVFITEDIASSMEELINRANREAECAVLVIPSVKGSTGFSRERIRKSVERAVGIDIFKTS